MREFPASPMQEAIHAVSADAHPGTTITDSIQISFNFGEPVDIRLLQKSWKWVTQRHGLLRSSFSRKTGNILSFHEHENCETIWRPLNWCNLSSKEISVQWNRLQAKDAMEPFSLSQPPLLRFHAIKLPGETYHFLWTCHPILLDEESIFLVLRDWLIFYEELSYGRQPSLQESLSYAAAIGAIDSADPVAARRHWKNLLQRINPLSFAAIFHPKASNGTPVDLLLKREDFLLEKETTMRLIQSAGLADAPLSVLLAAAWGLVLGRLSVNGEAMFGIYRSCRRLAGPQAAESVGLFESFLPFPIQIPEDLTCKKWLRALQEIELDTDPFLVTNIQEIWNHVGHSEPFPQLSSTLHYLPESLNSRIHTCLPQWMRFDAHICQHSRFPIQVLACGKERLSLGIEYLPSQISPRIVRQLFKRLLRALYYFTEPNTPVATINLSLPSEEEESVCLGMGTSPSVQLTSVDPFTVLKRIVQLYGSHTFVEKGNDSLSFSLAETYSSQFSTFLKSRSISAGTVLALMMPSSPWMLVALLGVLRAGCTCLPLDPEALPVKLEEYLSRHRVSIVITDMSKEAIPGKIQQTALILEESLWGKILSLPGQVLPIASLSPVSPVVSVLQSNRDRKTISYAELQTVVENAVHVYNARPNDRILCHHPQGSAAAIEEYFVALLTGATLIFPEKNIKNTRTAFQKALESVRITHLRLTAAFWSQWTHYLSEVHHSVPPTLRQIVIEAGHISSSTIAKWKEQNRGNAECIVFYSPSEFLGGGTATESLDAPELCEIGLVCGRPRPGVAVFLVDSHHRLLPSYSPGILAFCLNKDIQNGTHESGRIVAATIGGRSWQISVTDELAQWNQTGQLVLISQPYSQLPSVLDWTTLRKIEGTLASHPDIIDGIVRSFAPTGEQSSCLGAWIVPQDSHMASLPTTLDRHLREHLPRQLIPTHFALVTRFHLDPFGQINSLSLAIPKLQPIPAPTVAAPQAGADNYHYQNHDIESLQRLPVITTLQTGTSGGIALYFVHAGYGLVGDYLSIAQSLSSKCAVHCLMVPRTPSASSATVEKITCGLALVLRDHLPGEFALIGIGMGAIFAWELAYQLSQSNEKSLSLILFAIPSIGRKPVKWLQTLRRAFLREKGSKDLVEIIAEYRAPILRRKLHFFVRGKPDPKWRRRAPIGTWSQLYLDGSPLDKPAEVARLLTEVLPILSTPQP